MSAVAERVEIVPSLAELAATYNREIVVVIRCWEEGLTHAILAGDAMIAARRLVPRGEWGSWLKANINRSHSLAYKCEWLALNQDVIRGCASMQEALRVIGPRSVRRFHTLTPQWDVERALELRANGATWTEVANDVGVSRSTVQIVLDPKERERRNAATRRYAARVKAARSALAREQQAKAAKSLGISEQWASLHVLGEQMDAIGHGTGATPEIRAAFRAALMDIYRARDKISKVLGEA